MGIKLSVKRSTLTQIIFYLVFCLLFCSCDNDKEFEERVDEINNQLTYAEIKPQNTMEIEGISSMTTNDANLYEVCLTDAFLAKTHLFEMYKYTFNLSDDTTHKNDPIPLCAFIDTLIANKDEKIEALMSRYNMNIGFSLFGCKLSGNVGQAIADIVGAVGRLTRDFKIDIYIRGSADGYTSEWSRPISDYKKIYQYHSIDYLKPAIEDTDNPLLYTRDIGTQTIGDFYTNNDLPNLRAKFIKEDIIGQIMYKCSRNIRHVYILKGIETSHNVKNENMRNAQIFIRQVE